MDEAHAVTGASDRRRAAHALACRSRRVLLLTATPDTGDPSAFTSLCSIGALDRARATHRACSGAPARTSSQARPRRSVLLRVRPTPAEQRMHDLLERYTRRVWAEASTRSDTAAKLAAIVLRKRALSSATSLAVSASRRQQLLDGMQVRPSASCSCRSATRIRSAMRSQTTTWRRQAWRTSARSGAGSRRLSRRQRLAARAESKAARLARILARVSEPVIVFTEYRDTLDRLERGARDAGRRVQTMHGGMERGERERVQRAFNRGGSILLATDAASEGLNLHHACRVVIHYELPWRPARIEQRVGRIDRLGQSSRVHEIALVAAGTAERLVLAPLLARAARARASGGPSAGLLESLSEAAVLELVMGGELRPPAVVRDCPPRSPGHSICRSEAGAEVCRLEQTRTLPGAFAAARSTGGRSGRSCASLAAAFAS